MTIYHVTGNLHLGKTHPDIDPMKEFELYINWLCEKARDSMTLENKVLIIGGDFFDTRKTLSIEQYFVAVDALENLQNSYDEIQIILGNGDHGGRLDEKNHILYDIIPERVMKKVKFVQKNAGYQGVTFLVNYSFDVKSQSSIDTTSELKSEIVRISFDSHFHSNKPDHIQFGTPYQFSWECTNNPGGFIQIDEGKIEIVPYDRHIFKQIAIRENKIAGKNPIKWLSENRSTLKGVCLDVQVDSDVDKTLYSKFLGVLQTIDVASLRLSEDFSNVQETMFDEEQIPSVVDSIVPLLSRDGSKSKLKKIFDKIRKEKK